MLIYEQSRPGRRATAQAPRQRPSLDGIPEALRRQSPPALPEVSEMQTVRHYTRLSQKNFSIDTQFYPLGSCTMKYNPRACNALAMLPGLVNRHPLAPDSHSQGFLACMYDLQEILKDVTGMAEVSLVPAAGAQGEFTGVAMIRAYHDKRGDTGRTEIIVPDAAHGTNPATAVMCGYKVREIPTLDDGDVDIDALQAALGPQTAGIMLTNPSTLGVFERRIVDIARRVHDAGGLLYYDGANLNAILGKVRPGDMGFDVIHMNLHKTFSTPHGGGGPGAGPVGVSQRLAPFLPVPMVAFDGGRYRWLTGHDRPDSIGKLSAFAGNAGVLLRAYVYALMLGREGMVAGRGVRDPERQLPGRPAADAGSTWPTRAPRDPRVHRHAAQAPGKQLDDHGDGLRQAPARLRLPRADDLLPAAGAECLLIEPTETESLDALDGFVEAMVRIRDEAEQHAETVKTAPHTLPVSAASTTCARRANLDLRWRPRRRAPEPAGPASPYHVRVQLDRWSRAHSACLRLLVPRLRGLFPLRGRLSPGATGGPVHHSAGGVARRERRREGPAGRQLAPGHGRRTAELGGRGHRGPVRPGPSRPVRTREGPGLCGGVDVDHVRHPGLGPDPVRLIPAAMAWPWWE
jgi:glycine dehydrogenase subunit 2